MAEFDRIWFQADLEVLRALCEIPIVEKNLFWFDTLGYFSFPDAGTFVVKLPKQDVSSRDAFVFLADGGPVSTSGIGNQQRAWAVPDTWKHRLSTTESSLDPSLAQDRYMWLRYVTPPAQLLLLLKSMAQAHGRTLVFSHQMERGDSLYYEAYWVFDHRRPVRPEYAELLYAHETYLVGDDVVPHAHVLADRDEGPRLEPAPPLVRASLFSRAMRHLGVRTKCRGFPPDGWINDAEKWEPYRVSWSALKELSDVHDVSLSALLRGLRTVQP